MKLSDEEIELGKKEAAYPTRRLPEVREYFDHSLYIRVLVSANTGTMDVSLL